MDPGGRNERAISIRSGNQSRQPRRMMVTPRIERNMDEPGSSNHRSSWPRREKRQLSVSCYSHLHDAFPPRKRSKLNDGDTPSNELCDNCSSIDWSALDRLLKFEGRMTWRGKLVCEVGKRFRNIAPDVACPLCRQLRAPWINPFLKDQGLSRLKHAEITDEIHIFRNLRHVPHVNDFPTSLKVLRTNNAPYHVAVVPACPGWWKEDFRAHVAENGMVVVLPPGHSLHAEVFVPRQVPKLFSAGIVKPWLKRCRGHKASCSPQRPDVEGMKVIDCRSERPFFRDYQPDYQYVALSYVWGSRSKSGTSEARQGRTVHGDGGVTRPAPAPLPTLQSFSHNIPRSPRLLKASASNAITADKITTVSTRFKFTSTSNQLPAYLPKTIRDAIKVTRDLGFDFLWVDKYCIDQNSEDDKQRQCALMDKIYLGAQLTIFALGDDFESGLPGVSSPRRHWQQQYVNVDRYTFVYTLPDPHAAIRHSKWATRAWTYQEGLFSTRCLFFTNHQLYYECNAMNCTESLVSKMNHLHVLSGQRYRAFNRAGKFLCGNSNQFSHYRVKGSHANHRKVDVIRRCQYQICEFTTKELTRKDDILNAYSGIASFYSITGARIYSLAGLPIPYPMARIHIEAEYLDHLSYALSWTHRSRRGITDDIPKPQIRPGFPSWSWSGWEGEVGERGDLPFCWTSTLTSVRIGYQDGEVEDYSNLYLRQPHKQWLRYRLAGARKLFFVAPVLDSSQIPLWDPNPVRPGVFEPSYKTRVYMSKGPPNLQAIYERLQAGGRYQFVVVGIHAAPRPDIFRAIQLADRKGKHSINRRIELLQCKERHALTCLVLYTVNGVSRRAGLIKIDLEEGDLEQWDLSRRQKFEVI